MVSIQEYKLGAFFIDGRQFIGSIKILNDKIRYWERENHILDFKDLEELIKTNPEIIIVGTGAAGMLKIPERVRQELSGKGISLISAKTQDAVIKFNELTEQKKRVSGIFSSGS